MKVILFHTPECAHYQKALGDLQGVLEEEGLRPLVELIEIKSQAQAQILRIPGSPTIRINGEDIDNDTVDPAQGFSLDCRLYRHNGTLLGWPSPELIRQAVRKAKEARLDEWDYPVGCCG